MNASRAQVCLGQILNKVIKEPVTINKHGKPTAVVISYEEYEKFQGLEDLYWTMKSKEAAEEGYLSNNESESIISNILNK